MNTQCQKTKVITLAAITLLSFFFLRKVQAQRKFSKHQLETDLAILKSNLEENHGGLYTYSSKEEVDDWFNLAKANLPDSLSSVEFYKLIAPLNSVIKNGHTSIPYPSFNDNFAFLPIQLYKYQNSFFIKKSFSKQTKNLEGVQILAIDGLEVEEIYNTLIQNFPRDGKNLTFPSENLSSVFGLEYTLIYGQKSEYQITTSQELKHIQISLKGEILDDDIIKEYNSAASSKSLDFVIKEDVGILTFPTFSSGVLKRANYQSFLQESFRKMKEKNLQHLIIDVRNNSGGSTLPTQELLSYLLDKEFTLYKDVYTITNGIQDKKYYKKQGVFFLNTLSWVQIKKVKQDHYRRRDKEGMDSYSPKENHFNGKLYLLTNGNSFSATGEFTSYLKHNRKDVVFIGEEVGGSAFQNTSGISYTITLPQSKQSMKIPLVVWEMNVAAGNNGHGVAPDYWIRNTIKDEIKDNDSVQNFALEVTKSN